MLERGRMSEAAATNEAGQTRVVVDRAWALRSRLWTNWHEVGRTESLTETGV